MTQAKRPWCAKYRYPGREHFVVGTVWVRADGPMQEVEKAAEAELRRLFLSFMPEGQLMPDLVDLIPGQLYFIDEREEAHAA